MAIELEQQIMDRIGFSQGPGYWEVGRHEGSVRWDRKRIAGQLPAVIKELADAGATIAPPNEKLMELVASVAEGRPMAKDGALPTYSACLDAIQAHVAEYRIAGTIDAHSLPDLQEKYSPYLSESYVPTPRTGPAVDAELTTRNVGIVLPSEAVVRPVARRIFAGLSEGTEGPNELSVETFVQRMSTGLRSAETIDQFASTVLTAVQDARRADHKSGRAVLDPLDEESSLNRFDSEVAIAAVEELAPVLELKGAAGDLQEAVVTAARAAIVKTSRAALQSERDGAGLLG